MWNDRFAQLYGFPPALVTLGRPFKELFDYLVTGNIEKPAERYTAKRAERLANEKIFSAQHVLADGRTIAVTNHAMASGGWVSTHEDITDRKNSEIRIEQLAHFDGLTGLANRNLFKERLEARWRGIGVTARNSRYCSSTSTGSRPSTIPWGIRPETSFSKWSRGGSRPRVARATFRRVSAAMSLQ
jgi:hypothetical protein